MEGILTVVRTVFWGLLMLSLLVFVHEGGHFLASRLVGVRVTEFFLGLPCRFNLHRASRRIGTKFGVTPILLGGYAMVCGMEPEGDSALAARVLGSVHRRGKATVEDLAQSLSVSEDAVMAACIQLADWGSIAPVYDTEAGERPGVYYATTYAAMPRDAKGNTLYDGRGFDRAHATAEGEVWAPPTPDEEFFQAERSRTYAGKGFWARAFILVAGVAVNLVTGFLLLMAIYSLVGVTVSLDINQVGSVEAGSPADSAGIEAGDVITAVNGVETATFTEVGDELETVGPGGAASLAIERGGDALTITATLDEEGALGINVPQETVHLDIGQAASVTWSYLAMTAQSIGSLLNPQHTMEVLNSSTSVVGISVMAAAAAESGASTFLSVSALISFSLGFMNLLPIPPLDGGKLLIEVIQAIIRRPVSPKVQERISYVGVALFGLLFLYMLRLDIVRFIL